MTFRYYRLTGSATQVQVTYNPIPGFPGTQYTLYGTADQYWPAVSQLINQKRSPNVLNTASVSTSVRISAARALQDIWETSDLLNTRFSYSDVMTVNYPLQGEKHSKFADLKRAGVMVVGPVSVGSATLETTRRVDWAKGTVDIFNGAGWYGPGSSVNPLGVENSSIPPVVGYSAYGIYYLKYTRYTLTSVDYLISPAILLPGSVPGILVDDGVVTSAVNNVNSGTYDILTEIAELPETVGFLQDCIKKILVLGNDTQHRIDRLTPFKKVSKVASKIAALELQFRYAVMPIMYSIMDIKETLKTMDSVYRKYRASSDFEVPYRWDQTASQLLVGENPSCKHRCFIKASYTPDTVLSTLIRMIGFNPFKTLWELTPYSFVADWVVNIGDYIGALTSQDESSARVSTYSVKHDACEWRFSYHPDDPTHPVSTVILSSYRRIIINPSDHIGLSWNVNMNWKRYLDGSALLIQRLASTFRR